jgi:thiamine biosynthesis protein ThiS
MTHMPAQLQTITVHVNGLKHDIPEGMTLEGLLLLFHLEKKSIAVEHNHQVANKAAYGFTHLKDNDRVEIVHFVGGG